MGAAPAARIVVIGASLGGANAVKTVLAGLPRNFPVPLAIVLHRTRHGDEVLLSHLQAGSSLPVSEPVDKETVLPGHVYLAPADYHLLVDRAGFALSKEAPVHHSRPSIDVLFESAAASCGEGVIAVVLSGASEDGARGAALVKEHGGLLVVEDPESAHCAVMPRAAVVAAPPDRLVALERISGFLSTALLAERRGPS
jgi:two-component system chemotaxis response regulator CheB